MTDRWTTDQITDHAKWLRATHGDSLESLTITETAADHGIDVSGWQGDEWDAYIEAVEKLLDSAPDLTDWSLALGADDLEPSDDHVISLGADDKPIARIHFAFEPGMPEDMRTALVQGIGQAIEAHL